MVQSRKYPQTAMLEDAFFTERLQRGIADQPLTGELLAVQCLIEGVEHYEHGATDVSTIHADLTLEMLAAVVYDQILTIMAQI